MGKSSKKSPKRSSHRRCLKLDCGLCQVLRIFSDAGVFSNLSAFGVRADQSNGSPERGRINLPTNSYICSIHGDVNEKDKRRRSGRSASRRISLFQGKKSRSSNKKTVA